MKAFRPSRPIAGVAVEPPSRNQTFGALNRRSQRMPEARTGRTEQFNTRVGVGFGDRVRRLAEGERATLGQMLEAMLAEFEAAGASVDRGAAPIAERREGRTKQMIFWGSEFVHLAIGKVAAERGMSVSALIEDLLGHEVQRLDPHGGKFGVYVKR